MWLKTGLSPAKEQWLVVGTVVGMFSKMCADVVQVPSTQIFRICF